MGDDRSTGKPEEIARSLLAQAPRSETEIEAALARAGFDRPRIAAVLERLRRAGAVDDDRLAEHLLLTRAERLRHGPTRLLADLARRGLSERKGRNAWARLVERGDLDPDRILSERIRGALRRSGGRLGGREYARLYNALLRAGFESEAVEAALRRESVEPPDEVASERFDDDVP